jgi:hypothetical protein
MTNNQNNPREFDAVIGGETPPPLQGVVLGGIKGIKRRLNSSDYEVRITALKNAIDYGDIGLDLIINALTDSEQEVRLFAANLLKENGGEKGKQALLSFSEIGAIYSNNTSLKKVLDRILKILEEKAPDIAAALQPGLTREEIDEIIKDLPFHLPEEVYELYQWRNGILESTMIDICESSVRVSFNSLEESLKQFQSLKNCDCPSNILIIFWCNHEFGGEFFAVVLGDTSSNIIHLQEDIFGNEKYLDDKYVKNNIIYLTLQQMIYTIEEWCQKLPM